jgi:hypothetical protein
VTLGKESRRFADPLGQQRFLGSSLQEDEFGDAGVLPRLPRNSRAHTLRLLESLWGRPSELDILARALNFGGKQCHMCARVQSRSL